MRKLCNIKEKKKKKIKIPKKSLDLKPASELIIKT